MAQGAARLAKPPPVSSAGRDQLGRSVNRVGADRPQRAAISGHNRVAHPGAPRPRVEILQKRAVRLEIAPSFTESVSDDPARRPVALMPPQIPMLFDLQ